MIRITILLFRTMIGRLLVDIGGFVQTLPDCRLITPLYTEIILSYGGFVLL